MSDQEDGQPFINNDGEHLGTWRQLSNSDGTHGGWGVVGQSGELLAAVDEYDQLLDPATIKIPDQGFDEEPDEGFYEEPEDAYEDPRLSELREQVAALQERAENPPVFDVRSPIPGMAEEDVFDRLETTLQRVEETLHRTLTDRERNEVANRALSDGHADMVAAAGMLRAEGRLRSYDSGNPALDHEARVGHMVELLGDAEGTNPDAETGQPQRQAESYDVSSHQGRVDRAMDVMHGYDDTADTSYDSRTFETEDYSE